jgi:hypothetical protein
MPLLAPLEKITPVSFLLAVVLSSDTNTLAKGQINPPKINGFGPVT